MDGTGSAKLVASPANREVTASGWKGEDLNEEFAAPADESEPFAGPDAGD
jgi:hypothetical protein